MERLEWRVDRSERFYVVAGEARKLLLRSKGVGRCGVEHEGSQMESRVPLTVVPCDES